MSVFHNLVFKNIIESICTQLQNNKELIEQADVVFICGRSNTCLSSISLLVGEMIRKYQLTQKVVEINHGSEHPLTIVNSEMFTSDLINLAFSVGLPETTKILHIFDRNYKYRSNGLEVLPHRPDVIDLLKNFKTVVVDDSETETHIQKVLSNMAIAKLSGYVQVIRLASSTRSDKDDQQSEQVKRNKNSYQLQGLKVVFIQTFKNKDTGSIDLDIFSKRNKNT